MFTMSLEGKQGIHFSHLETIARYLWRLRGKSLRVGDTRLLSEAAMCDALMTPIGSIIYTF